MWNKLDQFLTCLASHCGNNGEQVSEWFDRIASDPSAGAKLDQAQEVGGQPIGAATMAQECSDYAMGILDPIPDWMKGFK